MSDMSGTKLNEPNQVDWDKVGGSSYTPPPPAQDASGKNIVYFGQLPTTIVEETDDDNYRQYGLDPIKLVKNGNGVDGYTIRFTRKGLKPFSNGGNGVASLIKGAGITTKPQTTADYDKAMVAARGRVVPFTIDWEAKNKQRAREVKARRDAGVEAVPKDNNTPSNAPVPAAPAAESGDDDTEDERG
mgnify:CR=1 FL=1